jgi:hypothetical protein
MQMRQSGIAALPACHLFCIKSVHAASDLIVLSKRFRQLVLRANWQGHAPVIEQRGVAESPRAAIVLIEWSGP